MTIGFAAIRVSSALCRSDNKSAVLNGARPPQHMPMCLSCRLGESRRHSEHERAFLRERSIEFREAKIVADRQSDLAPWQIGNDCTRTACNAC